MKAPAENWRIGEELANDLVPILPHKITEMKTRKNLADSMNLNNQKASLFSKYSTTVGLCNGG